MKDVKTILFDLDGTLADSAPSFAESASYAIQKLGYISPPLEVLAAMIGTPVRTILSDIVSQEHLDDAVNGFVDHNFVLRHGIEKNRIYDGVADALNTLNQSGYRLFVATSKIQKIAQAIVEHFGLLRFFAQVYGAAEDGKQARKSEIIGAILRDHGPSRENTIMVGDRSHDIIGAKENGLRSVGVLWGYGSRQELEDAGADLIASTPSNFLELLL